MDSLLAHVQSQTGYAAAFAVGVLLHVGVFTRGEWDLYTTKLLGTSIILNASFAGFLFFSGAEEFGTRWEAFRAASLLSSAVWAGLYSSLLVYRGAFHRLNRFPGPFWARISNFYVTSLSVKKFHLYEEVQQLHEKYGDIVRLGELFLDPFPNRTTIDNYRPFRTIHFRPKSFSSHSFKHFTMHQGTLVQYLVPCPLAAHDARQQGACRTQKDLGQGFQHKGYIFGQILYNRSPEHSLT